jgi:hypothetical protein
MGVSGVEVGWLKIWVYRREPLDGMALGVRRRVIVTVTLDRERCIFPRKEAGLRLRFFVDVNQFVPLVDIGTKRRTPDLLRT